MSNCAWCNAPFETHPHTPPGRQRFCSRRCQVQAYWFESQAARSEVESSMARHPSQQSKYRFRCTECDKTYKTFDKAAQCHWGVGGVEETAERAQAHDQGEQS